MRDRLGLTGHQVGMVMAEMWRQYLGVADTELIEFARPRRDDGPSGAFAAVCERSQGTHVAVCDVLLDQAGEGATGARARAVAGRENARMRMRTSWSWVNCTVNASSPCSGWPGKVP